MRVIPGLHCALNMDRGNIRAGEGAIVHDLFDARAGGRNLSREVSQTAGPIANDRGETGEPAVGDQPALDHAA